MEIRVLHIDDDAKVRSDLKEIVDGYKSGNNIISIKGSCDFGDGIKKLQAEEFDLVILDLCVGTAAEESEKVGAQILEQIKKYAFVPVVFFTGLPQYVKAMESDVVKVSAKGFGYDELYQELDGILATGLIGTKKEIDSIIREGLRSYFWNFVHPNKSIIGSIGDDVSLKYILMRRLAKSFSSQLIKATVNDPLLNKDLAHPMEFFIYPAVHGEFETGDILLEKQTKAIYIILTPACDFVVRKDGTRKADKILLAQAFNIKDTEEYKKLQLLLALEKEAEDKKQQLSKEVVNQIKNQKDRVRGLMKPGNDRFFFLPGTPFLQASIIDFQHKVAVTYKELEENFEVLTTLDDPFSQSMQSSFTRYYNRVGFPDLDVEYVLRRL